MILYFSATGNTRHVARELAKMLDDECIDLLARVKNGDNSPLSSEKPFVICAPIYVCEMPRFLAAYLKKQSFLGSRDVYFVFTSGGYCGPAGVLAKGIFRKKGMNYMGGAEITMPRNYVASDYYPMLGVEEIEVRLKAAAKHVKQVGEDILAGRKLKSRHVYLAETLITLPFNPVWCKIMQSAKPFYATDACIACGKCEKLCPHNNIEMVDGKPRWIKSCAHCMACIANCPTLAIEYGKITPGEDRYTFNKYSYLLKDEEK